MKKLGLYSTLLVLGLSLAACGSNNTPIAKPANTPATPDPNVFLNILNEFRSTPQTCMRGTTAENMPAVPPMTLNEQLNTSARLHSEDMANNNYFEHESQDGRTFDQRNANAGYTGISTHENIAFSRSTEQGTFEQWRTSKSGHCQAMMSADANEIGIGYGFNLQSDGWHYWTLVLGRKQQQQ